MTPIAEYIQSGETPQTGRVGVEVEHFLLDHVSGHPLTASQVEDMLEVLRPDYDQAFYEDGRLIALQDAHTLITLEPGSQFEVSFLYTRDMDQLRAWYDQAMAPVMKLVETQGADVVWSGGLPTVPADEVRRIDKHRYEYMEAWFARTGNRGREMMKATASVHVSIDYADEADFVRKVRAANILHPLLAFLMSNTPDYAGQDNPDILLRDSIWSDTDPARTGIPDGLFDEGFGYQGYADWLEQIPVILMADGGTYVPEPDLTVGQTGEKYGWNKAHIQHLLSMAFPDVRVKNFIEIRSADSVKPPYITAYAALIRALFYSRETVDWVLSLAQSADEIQAAKAALRKDDWNAGIYGQPVTAVLDELDSRARQTMTSADARHYAPLHEKIMARKHMFEG
ncbi:glutamate-cysteine ligase family protein [Faecalibaculum rodentium]|uniref:glutamate-cysteine ligase family protein n=1 Tax=Faecalibaculum rodentium TaxID=1702221 RepID=UPI001F57DB4C|nr:glutamate-cysteine ligase family protein [Faecalibaculum rodentium]